MKTINYTQAMEWIKLINSNILLTLALVAFAGLQWKAIVKQNNQNLFKTRMDCYSKINEAVFDNFLKILEIRDKNGKINKKYSEKVIKNCLTLSHLDLQIKYLFNKKIYDLISEFTKNCSKLTQQENELEPIVIYKLGDELKEAIEEFFNKNN